jgi:membrane associated rhomboid family serine protease
MFPLRDTIRARSFPIITYGLIALNVLIFYFESSLSQSGFELLIGRFGMVPARLSPTNPLPWLTLFSSMFLHGSWFHLISNMWTLFIFGDNVEDRMGSGRYLIFYILSGLAAGLAHALLASGSQLPTVGASGAIAGVLGGYLLLFPGARVITLVPVFFFWFIELPAFLFLGIWFLSQLSSGLMNLGRAGDFGGIAWWAHIGGFIFGFISVKLFARRQRLRNRLYNDEQGLW